MFRAISAKVAELADAPDLGSGGFIPWGFESPLSHQIPVAATRVAMKVELREQGPVRRTLEIEVEPEEIGRETQAVLRGYATKARIPGFRPGKAPLDLVRARFDKEVREFA